MIRNAEIDDLTKLALERFRQVHQTFGRQLRRQLPRTNTMFAHRLLRDLVMAHFPELNYSPTMFESLDAKAFAVDVRDWIMELARKLGGYKPDFTEIPEANYIFKKVSSAPSIASLLDGSYPVEFSSILGRIRPIKFQEWVGQGSNSISELAYDAANYTADLAGASAGLLDLYHRPEELLDAAAMAELIEDRFEPIAIWTEEGRDFLAQLDAVKAEFGLSDAEVDRDMAYTLALPSEEQTGMVWRPHMKPLAAAQAAFIFIESYYGNWQEDKGWSLVESLREKQEDED